MNQTECEPSRDHSVLERVIDVTSEVLALEATEISPESLIREDLGADSLDLVTLVWALEEEFGGKIEDAALETLTTPMRIAAYITGRMHTPNDDEA